MTRVSVSSRPVRRGVITITLAIVAAVLALAGSADAGPRRARLSRDLSERIAKADASVTSVIVEGDSDKIQTLARRYGAKVLKTLGNGAVLQVNGGQLDALSQDADVDHLSGDVPVVRMSGEMTTAIGANQVWAGVLKGMSRYTGAGIGVAVVDSGIAKSPLLNHQVVVSVDFTGGKPKQDDDYGHGTHVAGIIAGTGADYPGVAPDARLLNLRAMGPDGTGATSAVIAAIEWAIAHQAEYNVRVINLSLGHPVMEAAAEDPLCQAVQKAVDAGIVVVAAAGNFGKTRRGLPDRRRHRLARELTCGADRRRVEHERHAGAVGRCDGDVQLPGSDGDRRTGEAGAGGPWQSDRVGLGEPVLL